MTSALIATADLRRTQPISGTTAFDLWNIAGDELNHRGTSSRDARVRLLRHAMIHAGFAVRCEIAEDGTISWTVYGRCPVCEAPLA